MNLSIDCNVIRGYNITILINQLEEITMQYQRTINSQIVGYDENYNVITEDLMQVDKKTEELYLDMLIDEYKKDYTELQFKAIKWYTENNKRELVYFLLPHTEFRVALLSGLGCSTPAELGIVLEDRYTFGRVNTKEGYLIEVYHE